MVYKELYLLGADVNLKKLHFQITVLLNAKLDIFKKPNPRKEVKLCIKKEILR